MKRTNAFLQTMITLVATPLAAVLAAIIAVEAAFVPSAQANLRCEALFVPSTLPPDAKLYGFTPKDVPAGATLISVLPPDIQTAFANLRPKVLKKFEKHFQKRDRISAETEAKAIIRKTLFDEDATTSKFFIGKTAEDRREALTDVLHARLDHVSAEIRMEQILLKIGYGEGSATANKWSDFRAKYFRRLTFALRGVINLASSYAFALPLSYLKPYQNYQYYRPTRIQRHYWDLFEPTIRSRISSHDKGQLRELRIELALKFATRLLAAVVLAMILDEIAEHVWPEWRLFKISHSPKAIVETRARLERMAFENWKDFIESFTGERPDDNSPEARAIRERIDASTKAELWLHIHEGGPLSEKSSKPLSGVPQRSTPKNPEPNSTDSTPDADSQREPRLDRAL